MSDDYTRGFDDACAIYTKAALDMARTLADMAAMLNAERVLARRRALRLRWRHAARDRGDWSPNRQDVTYGKGRLHSSWPGDLLNWRRVISYATGSQYLPMEWRVRGVGLGLAHHRRPIAGPVGRLP